MTLADLLKEGTERGYSELRSALEGVTQAEAWAVLPAAGEAHLHSDGSIQGIVLHIATGKRAYASIAFRGSEVRWRDVADEVAAFEPDWDSVVRYLDTSHRYWMDAWADLTDAELNALRPTNFAEDWPAHRLIQMVGQHDAYHAGQIALLRYAAGTSETPPPSYAEDIRTYCRDSRHW